MTPSEALAVCRLRQWHSDRTAARAGHICSYRNTGWIERRQRQTDARIVRMLDFEKAFASLTDAEQIMLASAYADGAVSTDTARAAGCCVRKIAYALPAARRHLADALAALDLL